MGADCLGLVAEMPSGPGPISDTEIADITAHLPPAISSFLLTSRTEPEAVVDHVNALHPSVVQLVDLVPDETYDALRMFCPWVRIVQVVHVEDESSVRLAQSLAPNAHALLLDSGRPNAQVPELGGTGRTHDWALSRAIVAEAGVPVFMAGGLSPDNVARAIEEVLPYGVDLCSGIRTHGALDPDKLRSFMEEVRRADALRSTGG
jgi:phosphoribosylanthranilate isomerase